MAIGVITGIIIFAALIVGIVFLVSKFYDGDNTKGLIWTAISFVLLMMFILIPFSFHTVDATEVGVVKELGKLVDEEGPGTYFDFWVTRKVTKIDSRVRTINLDTAAYSKDAQTMTYSMKIQYQILPDKARDIVSKYGTMESLEARLSSVSDDRTKAVMGSYTAMDIIAKRSEMAPLVNQTISEAVGDNYFVKIVSVEIINIDFSDAFEQAVEDKMIAEQNQLKQQYENEAKVAKSKADAEAKIVASEAEAKANQLLEQTLTDKMLQKQYLEKWDGKLPSVVAGDETAVILPSQTTEVSK
jgi:regulator of protease activity HflC (stomatin/prohibitin superfamily)